MSEACVDLRREFGAEFRVKPDPQAVGREERADPWNWQVKTRVGLLYPYSGTHLGVQVDGHREIARRLHAKGYYLLQDGDTEKTFLMTVAEVRSELELLRPHRRPRQSAESREVASARLQALRLAS